MSELVSYDRRPEDLSKEIAETVSAIVVIVGKSIQSMHRAISLLKLSDEIRTAIRAGNLPGWTALLQLLQCFPCGIGVKIKEGQLLDI